MIAIVSYDVMLLSNYHGYKGQPVNLISYCMIDNICKSVKLSHLENLQIIQNINNLMFQVIFIFSD